MANKSTAELPVAALIGGADLSGGATEIGPGIYLSADISNSYLVTSEEGGLVVNTGNEQNGPIHRARYDALTPRIRYVVITQGHTDHYGGLQAFLGEGTELVTDRKLPYEFLYWRYLKEYYDERWHRMWRPVLGDKLPTAPTFPVEPDVLVDGRQAFTLGDRRFEVLATPGGETRDSVCVWLPDDGVVFTGNLFGPAWQVVPNLNPIRTEKARSASEYVRSAERVLSLDAEMLVTGHGQPVRGRDEVRRGVTRLRDAVAHLHDETVAGMNAGRTVHQLMREVTLPPELALGETYGKVSWAVRTIYEEYTGWFHQDYTSRAYDVPVESVYGDLVALAGADALVARAREHVDADEVLEALHLAEIVLVAAPGHAGADAVRIDVLQTLLARANDTTQNLNEVMWLRSELIAAGVEQA